MKKILFAAIAVCGFMGANAQGQTNALMQSAVSSSTNTTAGSVTSEFNLKLKVYNIIRIIPHDNLDVSATFNSAADLDGSQQLSGFLGLKDAFIVSSNRKFHASMTAGAVTVSNALGGAAGNSAMPLSVFSYQTGTLDPANVTLASSGWQTLGGSQTLVSSGNAGSARLFGVAFKATPGWDYEGGNYTVPVTVTATQD